LEVNCLAGRISDIIVREVLIKDLILVNIHIRGAEQVRCYSIIDHYVSFGKVCDGVTDDAECCAQLLLDVAGCAEVLVVIEIWNNGSTLLMDVRLGRINRQASIDTIESIYNA
jgi:hypothetical protein